MICQKLVAPAIPSTAVSRPAFPYAISVRTICFLLLLTGFLGNTPRAYGAFGLTTTSTYYQVDTGAGLVFQIRRVDSGSTTSPGDIMSLVYNGVEYQDQSKGSQINSGFDWIYNYTNQVSVTADVYSTNYIKITVVSGDPTSAQGALTHYYIARNGYPHIYMATSFSVEPDVQALVRYIARIQDNLLTNGPPPSNLGGTTYTVESSDIFGMPDGETRSKHYSNHRFLDWFYTGATGNGVGIFMMRDSGEGGSGGPFFRSLINQAGGDQEIYDIVNYGEAQTEAYRMNVLNGPYALVFNNGQPPTAPLDYSWLETAGLNLTNWVAATNRGAVTGTATGVPVGFQAVVGFANTSAQYWAIVTNGTYTTPLMLPGTYTATLYKQEYAVATASVTVSAGLTNTLNLTSTESNPAFVFKLGEWDGTPAGFLNASNMTFMHPSDVRMASWTNTDFTVESNPTPQFPCIQARQTNGTITLRFNLTAAQAAVSHTMRIGITTAYISGRPKISVNSWNSSLLSAPSEPSTRTFTIGSYRGNNFLCSFSVPSSAFVTGQNVMTITPISGTSDLGGWLSAGYVFDCLQLDGTPIAPLPPTNIAASLNAVQVSLSWTPVFNAVSYKIKRATTRGGPYTTIATNLVATFTDTNVVAATRYYYVVTSVNSLGESTNSAEVVAGMNPAMSVYLPFDENAGTNAADATGNGWNAALLNNATWNSGKYGAAVNLNGTSNYVSLPAGVVNGLSDFTIAAWVNQTSVNTWARVFDFGNDTVSYMMLAPRAASASGPLRFAITIASTDGEQQINGTSALPTGWHHVAVTLKGTTGILYVDGVAVGTNSAMTLKPSNLNLTTQNYIGKSQWPDPYLNGRVDDFRIYNGALSATQIAALVATPPLAPTNVIATAISANRIDLNWNAASGAVDYNLLRSTNNGGPFTTIATGIATTNYSDTGLSGTTTYYYVVAAADNIGATINSAEATATTLAAGATPTNLLASAIVPGQIGLAWNASALATNYVVKRANLTGGPYTPIATNAATSYTDTNVPGGFTYFYVVSALTGTGESANSAEANALALPTLSTYLKFNETSGTTAADSSGFGWNGTLINSPTWVAGYSNNAVNLSSNASQYVTLPAGVVSGLSNVTIAAWVKLTTTSGWSRLFDFGTGTSTYMFLTPQNGSSSVVRFAITTGSGAGEQQINGTAALPTGTWQHVAVTLNGSTGVLYVDGQPVGTNSAMTLTPMSLGSTTQNYIGKSQYADPYLNGLVDEFRIYSGALSANEVATFVTPLAAPGNLTAVAGDSQVNLNWNAVANAATYQLWRSVTNGGPYAQIATTTATNFLNTGLANGTGYFYVVKAANSVGVSAASAQVSARPTSSTPTQLTLNAGGNQLQFTWPADHTGWLLQAQTNSLTAGLGTNWVTILNTDSTNTYSAPINPAAGSVFYRLISP